MDWTTWSPTAKYTILDDVEFKYCPNWKAQVGCQFDFTVNPKYGKKTLIKGGIPCIILCNEDEDWMAAMSPSQRTYFERNVVIHYMHNNETFIRAAQD